MVDQNKALIQSINEKCDEIISRSTAIVKDECAQFFTKSGFSVDPIDDKYFVSDDGRTAILAFFNFGTPYDDGICVILDYYNGKSEIHYNLCFKPQVDTEIPSKDKSEQALKSLLDQIINNHWTYNLKNISYNSFKDFLEANIKL